jgi:hypothetical protein
MSNRPSWQETEEQVVEEFKSFVRDALAAYSFARWGLLREHEWAMGLPLGGRFDPDPTASPADGEVGRPRRLRDRTLSPTSSYTRWTVPAARAQLEPDGGPAHRHLLQQLIVFISTGWESEYRRRLARARDCAPEDLTAPVLDDLRRLRHDVVHHRGIATSQNSDGCEVLTHWVRSGEPIYLGPEKIHELWNLFPWHDLRAGS